VAGEFVDERHGGSREELEEGNYEVKGDEGQRGQWNIRFD